MGKRALFWAGFALSVLLSGCAGEELPTEEVPTQTPTPSAEVTEFALPYYAESTLHPITGENRTNLALSGLVYEGLFELDNSFEPQPVLTQSWSADETGLRYTFELKATHFSDGSPLTAQEAAASLELARKSPRYSSRLRDISRIQAEDNILTVTLKRAHADLPSLLDIPVVKEQEEGLPLGTGRYSYRQDGEKLFLQREGAPGEGVPDVIPLKAIRGADELIYAFDTQEIGAVITDLTGSDALGYSVGYEGWDYPTTDLVYLGFRTDEGFCADPALRQAVERMVDRASITTLLYSRHAEQAALPVHPNSSDYNDTLADSMGYSPQQAQALLEQAGYVRREDTLYYRGRPVELELLVDGENSFRAATAEYLAKELEKLGISVTVSRLSWSEYTARLSAGTFDLYLAETLMTADFDPESLVGSTGGLNFGKWNDPQTDLLLEAVRAGERGARRQLYQLLLEQSPIVPICFKNHTVLTQWGRVQDLTPTRADPFAGTSWRLTAG